jgi:hypothetical protein
MTLALSVTAFANVPEPPNFRPEPPPVPPAAKKATLPVKIERADLAKEGKGVTAKVVIPRKALARVAPGAPGSEKQSNLPWWSTLVAGVAMSVGAVGLLVAARGNKAARVVAAAALLAATFAGGYAIAAKPAPEPAKPVAAPAEMVVVEIVDDGEAVVITLPK